MPVIIDPNVTTNTTIRTTDHHGMIHLNLFSNLKANQETVNLCDCEVN